MPAPCWRHESCCGYDSPYWTNTPKCTGGAEGGTREGWMLGVYEAMGQYQSVYGVKPLGPHRKLADRLLVSFRRRCEACRGSGVVSLPHDDTRYRWCPVCESRGGFWLVSVAALDAARQRVIAAFPNSVPGGLAMVRGVNGRKSEDPSSWQPAARNTRGG